MVTRVIFGEGRGRGRREGNGKGEEKGKEKGEGGVPVPGTPFPAISVDDIVLLEIECDADSHWLLKAVGDPGSYG